MLLSALSLLLLYSAPPAFIGVFLIVVVRTHRGARRLLVAYAESAPIELELGSPLSPARLQGTVEGSPLAVRASSSEEASSTVVLGKLATPEGLVIRPGRLTDRLRGARRTRTGDAVFDDAVHLEGDEYGLGIVMTADGRARCAELVRRGGRVEGGELTLERMGPFEDVGEIAAWVELAREVASDLAVLGGAEALAVRCLEESLAGVRARCLALLWLHHPDTEPMARALQHLGERTSLRTDRSPEVERRLCVVLGADELATPDRRLAAAIALGSIGTRGALAALRSYARQQGHASLLGRAALRSVDVIRGRLAEAEPGGLSFAEPAGALEVVETDSGRQLAQTPGVEG